jgi:hypothetical protein
MSNNAITPAIHFPLPPDDDEEADEPAGRRMTRELFMANRSVED